MVIEPKANALLDCQDVR